MTLEEAITEARRLDGVRKEVGLDQAALDEAARLGFANGAFEELGEDVLAVVEEFYPQEEAPHAGAAGHAPPASSLRSRLEHKAARMGGA